MTVELHQDWIKAGKAHAARLAMYQCDWAFLVAGTKD
jgi:hypothetical protein